LPAGSAWYMRIWPDSLIDLTHCGITALPQHRRGCHRGLGAHYLWRYVSAVCLRRGMRCRRMMRSLVSHGLVRSCQTTLRRPAAARRCALHSLPSLPPCRCVQTREIDLSSYNISSQTSAGRASLSSTFGLCSPLQATDGPTFMGWVQNALTSMPMVDYPYAQEREAEREKMR
jgi:hypothetical protein